MRELLFADDSALVVHSTEENSGCFLRCIKEVRPEIYDQEDRGAVPTQLYTNPIGGYHGWLETS